MVGVGDGRISMAIESDQLQIQTMPVEIRVGMVAGPSAPLQDMFRVLIISSAVAYLSTSRYL